MRCGIPPHTAFGGCLVLAKQLLGSTVKVVDKGPGTSKLEKCIRSLFFFPRPENMSRCVLFFPDLKMEYYFAFISLPHVERAASETMMSFSASMIRPASRSSSLAWATQEHTSPAVAKPGHECLAVTTYASLTRTVVRRRVLHLVGRCRGPLGVRPVTVGAGRAGDKYVARWVKGDSHGIIVVASSKECVPAHRPCVVKLSDETITTPTTTVVGSDRRAPTAVTPPPGNVDVSGAVQGHVMALVLARPAYRQD